MNTPLRVTLLKVNCNTVIVQTAKMAMIVLFLLKISLRSSSVFLYSAPDDYTALNDTFQMSDSAWLQCVPISITSDSVEETEQECFTFSISTATSIAGLTLSPSEAEICISDAEGLLFILALTHRHRHTHTDTHAIIVITNVAGCNSYSFVRGTIIQMCSHLQLLRCLIQLCV